ncbi:PREDICTED: inner centromere protein isoform X2 [Crocodylus porosus]|uniref:inner centromere protein isoform X2 n=1 Tax=Crocodylus porosus TaxID=8502 RepID=UPI00093F2947|nr:PREDICTED: inner centromere protein isoform X2 [Crocodylus porosus]
MFEAAPGALRPLAARAIAGGAAMAGTAHLVETCSRRLAEFLRDVDETDLLWLAEIRDEAARMFGSDCNDEPELMPKTPSQKNRRRKKRISLVQDENEDPTRKRLSRRRNSSIKPRSSKRYSQKLQNKDNLGKICAAVEEASLHQEVTRSEATTGAKCSEAFPKKPAVKAIEERIPFVEISVNDRSSAELHLQGNVPETADEVSRIICLGSSDESPQKNGMVENQPVLEASVLVVSQTPEANGVRGSRGASKLKIANTLTTKATVNEEPEEVDGCAVGPQDKQTPGKELSQDLKDNAGTPTGSRSSRRSVRRSLMGKTSLTHRTSLAEKYSLASKRESMIRKSISNSKKKVRKSSQAFNNVNCYSSIVTLVDEEKTIKNGSVQEPSTSKQDPQGPRMSLRTRNAKKIAISNLASQQQQEESSKESNSNGSGETLEPPQSVRRKPSYKKAVDQLYDGQQAAEGGLSPPRKKTPSPSCPASKVVRPFKTFLHTVQKNQLLMTPSSVGRNNIVKSFIKHNTPLRTDPKGSFVEKERQRLEILRKKQDAEQQRKQKLEEEKRRRLEEMKLKREERLRKVLQARERVEQIEEEKKRRIEQKLAQVDEKTEKVREERLAEEKIKKRVAAKKMEEAEARRKQDEDARKLKALQLEEEERRHKELMQKRKEEEQERVRKIAEQRQAEQERERQLAAERELEKKKEQERIQAERERERQEKEKILRQQKELMAAREKERLRQEMEEKQKRQEEQRLAELEQQEQEKRKLQEEQEKKAKLVEATAGSKQLNVTVDVENSSLCNSYQMTPQGLKGPKPPKINPSNNYGMDLNSDDSTDDESQPRKPIPAWANGSQLSQAVIHQYYNPLNTDILFGTIISPKLEDIFYKSKPRYFKRTSSAVWNSPPFGGAKNVLGLPYSLKKY